MNTEPGLKTNKVKAFRQGMLTLTYEDTQTSSNGEGGSRFIRTINNNKYHYNEAGGLELFYVQKPTKYISTLQEGSKIDSNFMTLDIETRLVKGRKETGLRNGGTSTGAVLNKLLSASREDGKLSKSFYLTDFNMNLDLILEKCIKSLLVPKYDGYKIYVHNLANFDSIFLMKVLVRLGQVQPIINKGRLISIKFKGRASILDKPIILQFLDSYQLLLASLSKLGEAFDCKTNKGLFPHKFVYQDNMNLLKYVGPVPNIGFFGDQITLEQYNSYLEA